MSDKISEKLTRNPFESIKKINQYGQEYWSARDLMSLIGYSEYRFFKNVIEKAIESCENSNISSSDHFEHVHDMVEIGSKAKRKVENYQLSRYACYLIIQNADPSKELVALGQTYFAVQTRKQELHEDFENLTEDEKRLQLRNEMKKHNAHLADAAKNAGVMEPIDYAIFQNHGYKGLYGGLTASDIKQNKNLKKSQDILDHMGSEELAANLFRATQTEAKLRRENIQGKTNANITHFEVGRKVRKTIEELGGTMPENLPSPTKSIKQLENKSKKPDETTSSE